MKYTGRGAALCVALALGQVAGAQVTPLPVRDTLARRDTAATRDTTARDTTKRDTTARDTTARDSAARAPLGIRLRLGRDTLPLQLPAVRARAEAATYREAAAQLAAARATAFRLNTQAVLESVWGQVASSTFATRANAPGYPTDAEPDRPRAIARAQQLVSDYSDLAIQFNGRLELRGEKAAVNRCGAPLASTTSLGCRSAFEPLVDFQYGLRSGGVVADRVRVNVDYDSQREFDASNTLSIAYDGKPSQTVERLEIGNVTFQAPVSRFLTAGIPSGNFGVQAVTRMGPMRLRAILAQQKGNVVRDRVFTVGDRALQEVTRTVEDYQFEPRRFFFTVDPERFAPYPNVDILNPQGMMRLAAALPDSVRPTRLFVYRLLIGGQPPNPNGPQFRIIGDPRSRRGQVYEYLREGVDYYADPSLLWIALVRPLSLNNERLVVAYRVRIGGVETVRTLTGGTPDLEFTPGREQFANLLWDPNLRPSDPAFDREIRSVYRVGGSDVLRQSITVKVVTGSGRDQEKPPSGTADTYLTLFGLAQSTNSSTFDVENRIWPRPTEPNLALGVGSFGQQIIRDRFLVFPSLRPFAANGPAGLANPRNDTVYSTPAEYLASSQRPQAIYHIRLRYQSQGNGAGGTLLLGAVQLRPNSERILVDNIPLTRGADYTVDYDLGRVVFARPDTLFPRPRQVSVQFEENPIFAQTPTSIFGGTAEFLLPMGQVNITALSQSQRTPFTRPTLGLEPAATLIGGISALLSFDAEPLTRAVSRLPFGETIAPSRVTVSGEFAASKPQPNAGQQAYIESFEGGGGVTVRLDDRQWYYGSQPAAGSRLLGRLGPDALDLSRASTLAWQSNGLDISGREVRYSIEQIDPDASLVGAGVSPPEQLLWMTLYPLSVGGLRKPDGSYAWRLPNAPAGRRWRSIRTPLGPSGTDLSRSENIEFWALVNTAPGRRARNPTLVLDVGDISENSIAFGPDTAVIRRRSAGGASDAPALDSSYSGKSLQGYDRLDSERDPFSRSFNANVNDNGLPGDVLQRVTVLTDTLPAGLPVARLDTAFRTCNAGYRTLRPIGDSRADCTVGDLHLDEEDLDNDNVLDLASTERDAEQLRRYVLDLSDERRYNRVGKCVPSATIDPTAAAGDSMCWVYFKIPFAAADDTLGDPLLRRARALRITMFSGAGVRDDDFSMVALDRLRFTGAPWLKRRDVALRGIGGEEPSSGFVAASTIGTQDRRVTRGERYVSPPGVSDAPDSRNAELVSGRVQINERSLRLTASDVRPYERAEAYYRFPEGDKNFLGYEQLRVWAKGVGPGWGTSGELQFYIKVGRDASNFYMYRTPLNGAVGQAGWQPEVRVDFRRFFALRAQIQNAYLRGTARNTCTGIDSALIANTPPPPGALSISRYAACDSGYVVYTLDPGGNPPNLAAVQELSVGMVRTDSAATARPITPGDTLELWVDDIRLGGVVSAAGFAGQFGVSVVASDFADIRANVSRRDPNFRQLGEQPTFLTDNSADVSAALHLEKLLPRSFGYSIPLTVNYSSASSAPLFVSQSDLQADAVEGLRTPRAAATSMTLAIRRTTPLRGGMLAPLVNNLSLNSSYTAAATRSEYQIGRAKNFQVGLDYNLSRALPPTLLRFTPTELHLTTAYVRGRDERLSFLKPADAPDDLPRLVNGITKTWRNGASLEVRPLRSARVRLALNSVRDLRGYGDASVLGLIDASERDRIGGLDLGLERERGVQTGFNFAPSITPWLRARFDANTSYNMLRDPNSLGFVRTQSTGDFRIPRRLGNSQNTTAGVTIDLPRLAAAYTLGLPWLRRLATAIQPIDVSLTRTLLSAYDGSANDASLPYQLGLGSITAFRRIGEEPATAAGLNTQLSITNSIGLPFGAVLSSRVQHVTLRNWTRRFDDTQATGDGSQTVFPDLSLRWSIRPVTLSGLISSFAANARVVGTRQLLGNPAGFGLPSGDNGETRLLNYPVSTTIVWAGARPFTTTAGLNVSRRVDDRPGNSGRGNAVDVNAEVAKAFMLPASWNPRSDLRTRLTYQQSQGQNFVVNPLALTQRSRLTDNGRQAFSLSADTDVAENLSSSFVISQVASFDRNLNRRFTQTVLSAILNIKFYAGELK